MALLGIFSGKRLRRGVHPPECKEATAAHPCERPAPPESVHVCLAIARPNFHCAGGFERRHLGGLVCGRCTHARPAGGRDQLQQCFDPAAVLKALEMPNIKHTGVPSTQLQAVSTIDPANPESVYEVK